MDNSENDFLSFGIMDFHEREMLLLLFLLPISAKDPHAAGT